MILLKEKHRISPAPLMTVAQYLKELEIMIREVRNLIQTSFDVAENESGSGLHAGTSAGSGIDAGTGAGSAGSSSDGGRDRSSNIDVERQTWLERLEELQNILQMHCNVNPEKLISDWKVYNTLCDLVEVRHASYVMYPLYAYI